MPNYDNIAKFVNAGIRGVRAVDKDVPVMLHLDNGGNNALYREWFDEFTKRGEDFQIIGLSYYPFWHGTLDMLTDNMNDIAERYGKDLIVAEVSMGYTMEDYKDYEKLSDEERKGYATKQELVEKIEYPMMVQGQYDFMEDFLNRISHIKGNRGKGFFYWEPAWLPVNVYDSSAENAARRPCQPTGAWEKYGSGWASSYAGEYDAADAGKWYGGSAVDNQALFDFTGHPLESLKTFAYVHTGTKTKREVVSITVDDVEIEITDIANVALPTAATVAYNEWQFRERRHHLGGWST